MTKKDEKSPAEKAASPRPTLKLPTGKPDEADTGGNNPDLAALSPRRRQATGQLLVSPRRASANPDGSVEKKDVELGKDGKEKFEVEEWWVIGTPKDVIAAWRSLASEFLAVMLFVFMGTGSVLATVARTGEVDGGAVAAIGFAFGLAIATMVYATANLSGGHLNPAVSIAIAIAMKMPILQAFAYVLAQVAGALVGSGLLRAVTPEVLGQRVCWGCTTLAKNVQTTITLADGTVATYEWSITQAQGVFFELIMTFILVFTVFSTAGVAADAKSVGRFAPLSIGFAVLINVMAGANFTGGSLNPARSFGPAAISNVWTDHWVYWVGPISGGILAGLVYKYIFVTKDELRAQVILAESLAIENERQARLGR
jgi:MIP family channel proteins